MDEKSQENEGFEAVGVSTTESLNISGSEATPHQLATSKDYSSSVVNSSPSSPLPEAPPNVEQPEQPAPLVKSPTEEQNKGASSEATFSLSAANISVQWSILCKESEQLSEKILNFANKLNRLSGIRNTDQLQPAVSNAGNDETAAKIKEDVEMLDTTIKEAVKIIQNFSTTWYANICH